MRHKGYVSLHGIAKQIDQVISELTRVEKKALTKTQKRRLAVKIKKLKAIRGLLPCPRVGAFSYGIPTA